MSISWDENGGQLVAEAIAFSISLFGCALRSEQHLHPCRRFEIEYAGKKRVCRVVYNLQDSTKDYIEVGIAFDQEAQEFWDAEF